MKDSYFIRIFVPLSIKPCNSTSQTCKNYIKKATVFCLIPCGGLLWDGKRRPKLKMCLLRLSWRAKILLPIQLPSLLDFIAVNLRFTFPFFCFFSNNEIVNIQVKLRLMDQCHRHKGGLVICSNKNSLCKCPSRSPAICFCGSCFSPVVFSRVQGHYIVWPQTNLNVDRAKSANLSEYTQPDPPRLFSWKYTGERDIFQCI